jgi:hypothetical protein
MKKLYILEVLYAAYVWAEDEDNAERFVDDVQFENPEVTVTPLSFANGAYNPLGWEKESLVYHAEEYDLKLEEAFKKMEEQS